MGRGVGDAAGTQAQPADVISHTPSTHRSGQAIPGGHGGQIAHEPAHAASPHTGVDVGCGVGGGGGTQAQPFAVSWHVPTSESGSLQIFPGGQGNPITQDPSHGPVWHAGVGVGLGVNVGGGTQAQPLKVSWHVPRTHGGSGQTIPGGHAGQTTQEPPHGTFWHWGVGVDSGVGVAGTFGTHVHPSPMESAWHVPSIHATSGQMVPVQGGQITQEPWHAAASAHAGVGVGLGVNVGNGTHAQLPPVPVHCPRRTGTAAGQGGLVQGTETMQRPPQVASKHCAVGISAVPPS